MKKKVFLSIDWDFFFSCSVHEREKLFVPQRSIDENTPLETQLSLWKEVSTPQLLSVGANTFSLAHLKKYLFMYRNFITKYLITESHKELYKMVMDNTTIDDDFLVVNIDFHHDNFDFFTQGEKVNCSNWVTRLLEERPYMSYKWIGKPDSDSSVLGGAIDPEFVHSKTGAIYLNTLIPENAEIYTFLCRSGFWSPPHLDVVMNNYLVDLMQANAEATGAEFTNNLAMKDRWKSIVMHTR